MDLFLSKKYLGRPTKERPIVRDNNDLDENIDDETDDEDGSVIQPKKRTWIRFFFTIIFYVTICLILSAMVSVFATDLEGSSTILTQARTFLQQIGVLRSVSYRYGEF